MSMKDKSYCGTFCDQKDCKRNLQFNKPDEKYYLVSVFDTNTEDHSNCVWKIYDKKGDRK